MFTGNIVGLLLLAVSHNDLLHGTNEIPDPMIQQMLWPFGHLKCPVQSSKKQLLVHHENSPIQSVLISIAVNVVCVAHHNLKFCN